MMFNLFSRVVVGASVLWLVGILVLFGAVGYFIFS